MKIPFYSQKTTVLIDNKLLGRKEVVKWENSLCGLTCALMVLNAFSNSNHTLSELLRRAEQIDGYDENKGWIHTKLAGLLLEYGIEGTSQTVNGAADIFELLKQNNLVIASVAPRYFEKNSGIFRKKRGHLVLIFGMTSTEKDLYQFHIHDPGSETTEGNKDVVVDDTIFMNNFSGNVIAFTKSDRTS